MIFRLLAGGALAVGAGRAVLGLPCQYGGIEDVLAALNRIAAPCVAVEISAAEFRRRLERDEEYRSWVRCLDVERAAGDLTDEQYEAERRHYAVAYGIES